MAWDEQAKARARVETSWDCLVLLIGTFRMWWHRFRSWTILCQEMEELELCSMEPTETSKLWVHMISWQFPNPANKCHQSEDTVHQREKAEQTWLYPDSSMLAESRETRAPLIIQRWTIAPAKRQKLITYWIRAQEEITMRLPVWSITRRWLLLKNIGALNFVKRVVWAWLRQICRDLDKIR